MGVLFSARVSKGPGWWGSSLRLEGINESVGVDLPEPASLQNQLDRKQRRFRLEPGHPFLAYSLNRVILSVYAGEIAAWTLSGENRASHVHWHYRFGNPANPC